MELFTAKDFKVFDIPGFYDRMQAIAERVRPKLAGIGEELVPSLSGMVDQELFVHVAKHARRTVNPPNDTWAAIGAGKRGYKKDVHFKVAVSRHCVRLLFEVGPEYYDKTEWALKWRRDIKGIVEAVGSGKQLGWFKDEHDEDPEALLKSWTPDQIKTLGTEVTRRRDGQLVIGRRIDHSDLVKMKPAQFKRLAQRTFKPVAGLFSLHDQRVLV
jgi:uncharacterized protein YktB (UPF0637 family)